MATVTSAAQPEPFGRWSHCRSMHRWRCAWLVALIVSTASVSGCSSGVRVRKSRGPAIWQTMRAGVVASSQLSFRTSQLLRRHNLHASTRKDADQAIQALDRMVRKAPDANSVFALAELCFVTAQKEERLSRPNAMRLYLGAVAYAYFYLFDPSITSPLNPYDPCFRQACDLYNDALAKCIRLAQRQQLRFDRVLRLEFVQGAIDIEVTRHGFVWAAQDFGSFLFAHDFGVEGLSNHYHSYGMGVPLIAVRPQSKQAPQTPMQPKESSFPVTAFLRMNCSLCDPLDRWRQATLELYDPLRVGSIEVAGAQVPLESDLTTPLGYFLSQAKLERLELKGVLRPEKVQSESGLQFLEPYEQGKIPVVLIHGFWSSPLFAMPMFNDLRGDPELRKSFQFWFFSYPTGTPMLHSAQLLRRSLRDARRQLDPQGSDAALDNIVLVGHSMGGLLAKTMTQDSGTHLWDLVSKMPLDRLKVSDATRAMLGDVFFFERVASVRRVVFIATPHRGSAVSTRPIARLASTLITMPTTLVELQRTVVAGDPQAFKPMRTQSIPTSIDNLSPDSPIIRALDELPIPSDVPHHSIIGDIGTRPNERTDGIVEYASAHLDSAASELIIPAGHRTCHSHPLAVLEVRRILLEHLRQSQ